MAFQPTIPFPVAIWDEHPLQVAAAPLTGLVPYRTVAGYWVLVPLGTQPAGAVQGAWAHGTIYDTLTTGAPIGLRHTRTANGFVYSY